MITIQSENDNEVNDFTELLNTFLEQIKTGSLKTKHYLSEYHGLDVVVSFGQGTLTKTPWICFLKKGQRVVEGYYVSLYFDKEKSLLFVVLGESETKTPQTKWNENFAKTYPRFLDVDISPAIAERFPKSRFFSQYGVDLSDVRGFVSSNGSKIKQEIDHLVDEYTTTVETNFWKVSTGEGGAYWPIFKLKNIIAVGYEGFGNYFDRLVSCRTSEQLKEEMRSIVNAHPGEPRFIDYTTEKQLEIQASMLWDFLRKMKAGDYIVANRGVSKILAVGRINSEAKFDRTISPDYHIFRDVHWIEVNEIEKPPEVGGNWRQTIISLEKPWFDIIQKLMRKDTSGIKGENNEEKLLQKKGQIILFGPPGTGKTYITRHISVKFAEGSTMDNVNDQFAKLAAEGRIQFITFHPSYSYEEFVEGITVKLEKKAKKEKETSVEDSNLDYYLKDGLFKVMVKDALRSALGEAEDKSIPQLLSNYESKMRELTAGLEGEKRRKKIAEWWTDKERFVLIIDEINRGDMSKILGELITLLEADKRLGMENELIVTLPYSQQPFSVPPNLFIIGTMNTADKSIALLDVALRRRFGFVEMPPNLDLLGLDYVNKRRAEFGEELSTLFSSSVEALKSINARIAIDPTIGRDKCIGHAFLFKVQDIEDLLMVWNNDIVPMLEEYCYGRYSSINKLVFGKESSGWFTEQGGFKQLVSSEKLSQFLGEIPIAKSSG